MSITVKQLIAVLQKKQQDAAIECIVVKTDGTLVCMHVEAKAADMATVLKLFNRGQ